MRKITEKTAHLIYISSPFTTLALVLVIACVIFNFSGENATESSKTSGNVTEIVIEITKPDFDTLTEPEQVSIRGKVTNIVRKSAHFFEFAALGFSLMLHINSVGQLATRECGVRWIIPRVHNKKERRYSVLTFRFGWLAALFLGAAYAVSDEIHQKFVDGRGPGVTDVLIDTAGVACGIVALLIIWFIGVCVAKKKERKHRDRI